LPLSRLQRSSRLFRIAGGCQDLPPFSTRDSFLGLVREFSSPNLPIHVSLASISLHLPALRRVGVPGLVFQSPVPLLRSLAACIGRLPAHPAFAQCLPVPDILRRPRGSLCSCLLAFGSLRRVCRGFGFTQLPAGFLVRLGVGGFALVLCLLATGFSPHEIGRHLGQTGTIPVLNSRTSILMDGNVRSFKNMEVFA